ncbi:hypothetical protein GGR53DRAFT_243109 [Hypoxylon sp. FL1150]|nr:hypothetical protein GGR53DRAFT_243109 [Hypoxylon sp. FL1150]
MASPQTPSPSPSPTPPQPSQQLATTSPPPNRLPHHGTHPFLHNVALGVTPISLLALFLPPRRLDLRMAVLGGVALWGTNQLVHDYSGTSTMHRIGKRLNGMMGTELPEKARETQIRLRAEKAERARRLQLQQRQEGAGLTEEQKRLLEEQRRKLEQKKDGKDEDRGMLERVWMGDSGEDWKEKRDRREKEALREGGGGIWGLITDQISEVWSGGRKKEDEGEKGSDREPKKS